MPIIIDFPKDTDLLDLLALGKQYYNDEYGTLAVSFDSQKTSETVKKWIKGDNNSLLLISRDGDGEITGFIYGTLGKHFYSHDLGCTMYFMYVAPKYRGGMSAVKLMHAFKRWGVKNNAKAFYFNVASGIRMQETDTFLQKMGFQLTGGTYMCNA